MNKKRSSSWQWIVGSCIIIAMAVVSIKLEAGLAARTKLPEGETWKLALGLVREVIREEIQCPPVGDMTKVAYEDTYLDERAYGGDRDHYGTDLIALDNRPGNLKIQSMTYGTITRLGWNELGGWRVGVTSPSGIYYYYAHLESYAKNLYEGMTVVPGTLLGYMGDSGYGPEGTTGKFVTHLHLGIQVYPESGDAGWINPYTFLTGLHAIVN